MRSADEQKKFPAFIAREKAHSLERFNRLHGQELAAKIWRSWGDLAGYSAKRMALLYDRSDRPLKRVEHRPMWFAAARKNVSRIGHVALQNPWKRTIDISIRRFREWLEPPFSNQIWMAVALIETSRLAKRTGKQKPILPGWASCFTRNRHRLNGEKDPTAERTSWQLSLLRNTKVRFHQKY